MQEEVTQKTIALSMKTGKLTAQALQAALKKYLQHRANAEYFYQKSLRDNPQIAQAASNPISRMWQKRRIKQQYAKAARQAGQAAAQGAAATAENGFRVTKLAAEGGERVAEFAARNWKTILIVAVFGLLALLLITGLQSCTVMAGTAGTGVTASSYFSKDRIAKKECDQMSELFSIQLQNRQQQGRDGVWLDLPTTTEQVQAALRQIGISSDNPQGLFISGYFAEKEKRFAIPYNMVLASNVDELNFLAARLETLSAGERAELNAALQAPQSELFSIGRITDFPENVDYYVHLPDVHGPAQLGDYYLNRSGMVDMPEEWKGGIDTAQFGRYVAQQEQGVFTEYGYLVKNGDEWQKVHEGQSVPEEYRVLSFPAPEILRDAANIPPPVQPETEPQKVIPIILNGKDSAERMKEITDRLETGIQQLFDSDRYKAYLTTMAKFHNYSFNNTLLIAMQGGQLVAGFNKWKDTFHRTVKKGEKGIKILAPAPYKVKQKIEKLDEQGKPILGKDGKPLTEEKTVQIPAFKVVSVFDVSQTEGEPLPTIAVNELSGSVQDYQDFFKALEQASPVPIGFEDIEGGAHGYFHLLDNRIAIQEGIAHYFQ